MTRTEFRKLYFFTYSLQRTSHDFEYNRKTILVEMNQSILSWEVSQPPPYAQNCQPAPAVSQEQQETTIHLGSEFENQIFSTLKKEAIVLVYYMIAWSAVVLGINTTSNAGSNFHEAKLSESSCITSAINP